MCYLCIFDYRYRLFLPGNNRYYLVICSHDFAIAQYCIIDYIILPKKEREIAMTRDYKKESAWERQAYQIFSFKARKDTGEADSLKKVMGSSSFADWVRKHLSEDLKSGTD